MQEVKSNNEQLWIGIQGGSCAGKSTVAEALEKKLGTDSTLVIALDQFYFPFDRHGATVERKIELF